MRHVNFVFALKQLRFEVELIPWTFGSCSKSLPTFLWALMKGAALLSLCQYFWFIALKSPNVSWKALQSCSSPGPLHEALLPSFLPFAVPQLLWEWCRCRIKCYQFLPAWAAAFESPHPCDTPARDSSELCLYLKNSHGKKVFLQVFF